MNEIEKICKEIQCPHFIVWSFGYGNCISCKLQVESYNIESVADIKELLSQAYNQLYEYNKCGATQHILLWKAMGNIEDALKELED